MEKFLIHANNFKFEEDLPKEIHQCLMAGILPSAGSYREVNVHVSKSSFSNPPFEEVPHAIAMFMKELNARIGIFIFINQIKDKLLNFYKIHLI